ncbi:hypothetical protein BGW36DRAFT_391089 [Talaromyces proteolyticus]|uniref:Zn(2)-C6 fungal-type domain-containing protein n=1 Tax=Talaromyces proteolyticus TaxID=1131652 RepID=A0AAD4KDG7_9EURO|nr:uncharacterized protein BGW36DRAFT_391089 [Talaromyces proteolyticus]KAH8689556.1 hypothetical protein BGW36DRAFT_391089 [Talaromyces proteolyticus]
MENTAKSKCGQKTRTKTGCRTCRIRRVKCDETPGACLKCTSTGRKCESYDLNRLPARRGGSTSVLVNRYRPRSNWAGKTSDERRCLSYFQSLTVPMMNYWFDHSLWDRLILQLVQAEPAVCHAVVAFSALHEAAENANGGGRRDTPIVLLEDMTNRHQRFALEQYNRSISHLNSRIRSNDPAVKNTALICCFLYIFFELFRGKYDRAFNHLKKGVNILKEHQSAPPYAPRSSSDRPIEDSLAAAIMHLDLQGSHFGVSQIHDRWELYKLTAEQEQHDYGWGSQIDFDTFTEAWIMRDKLFHDFCVYGTICEKLTTEDIKENYTLLFAKQKRQQIRLAQFEQALDRLQATTQLHGSITKKNQRALDLIRFHHFAVSTVTDTLLIKSPKLILEKQRERFSRVVDLAEQIVADFREDSRDDENDGNSPQYRPRFLMDIGIITPLYFASERSGDPLVTKRAMKVLQSWPHREGLWDSELALTLVRGMDQA